MAPLFISLVFEPLFILCLALAPADQKEVRIDLVDGSGVREGFIARRDGKGFDLYEIEGVDGKRKIARVDKELGAFKVAVKDYKSERVALKGVELQAKKKFQQLKVAGERVTVTRRGATTFVKAESQTWYRQLTYVVH